jgi:hypothetical protein
VFLPAEWASIRKPAKTRRQGRVRTAADEKEHDIRESRYLPGTTWIESRPSKRGLNGSDSCPTYGSTPIRPSLGVNLRFLDIRILEFWNWEFWNQILDYGLGDWELKACCFSST